MNMQFLAIPEAVGNFFDLAFPVIAVFCAFLLGHLLTLLFHSIRAKSKMKQNVRRYSQYPVENYSSPINYDSTINPISVPPQSVVQNTQIINQNFEMNYEPVQIGLSSVIGSRKYQQDSVVTIDPNMMKSTGYRKCIAVLCDGMGGMEGGERASAISAKTLYEDYIRMFPKNIPSFFRKEVRKLDGLVCGLTNEKNEHINSGSTLISVIIEDGRLYWVSVGDSRIYIIRNNEIVQITTDHNYYYILRQQAESGLITYEEAASNPKAEALISYIGIGRDSEIDTNDSPLYLQDGDLILLCSDGLYKTLPDMEILNVILQNQNDVTYAANALTQTALDKMRKGQDNTSVVLLRFNGRRNY